MRAYPAFPRAIPLRRVGHPRVTHPSATKKAPEGTPSVRLACVTHAASVCPEPGSNSPSSIVWTPTCRPTPALPRPLNAAVSSLYDSKCCSGWHPTRSRAQDASASAKCGCRPHKLALFLLLTLQLFRYTRQRHCPRMHRRYYRRRKDDSITMLRWRQPPPTGNFLN